MAKTKKKQQKKAQRRSRDVARPPRQVRATGLDALGARYAQLLADPCNGPLVTGPFGDADGGIVQRFESDFIINSSATETSAYVCFVPGTNTVYGPGVLLPLDSTPFSGLTTTGPAPGGAFITASVGEYRCLSACIQVYWPGSELNRSGIISAGQFECGQLEAAGALTTANLRSSSSYVERVPETMVEIIWRPSNFDLTWNSVFAPDSASAQMKDKHTALVVTGAGLTVATGLRVRMVTVIEWKPQVVTLGAVTNARTGPTSRNTLPQILEALDYTGNWMYKTASGIGRAASSLYSGFRAMGQVAYGVSKMTPLLMG